MKESENINNKVKPPQAAGRSFFGGYKYEIYLFAVSLIALAVHIHLASTLNLGNDEAHYYVWSLKPSLGYLDDAPMTGWIIAFFTRLFGTSQLSVRLGAVIFSFLDGFLIYYLAWLLFGSRRASFFAFLFFLASVIFGTVLSVMVLPDAPLVLFSLCFLIFFYKAVSATGDSLARTGRKALFLWALAGVSLGLAFLSKYTAALIPPSALLYLLVSNKNRRALKTLYPYAALGIALLVFSPAIWWNWTHNFISFRFQLSHGFSHPKPGIPLFIAGWAGQFLVITPFIYLFLIGTFLHPLRFIKRAASKNIENAQDKDSGVRVREGFLFSICLSVPILLFFIANGYSHRILVHWPDIGYLAAFPAMGFVAGFISGGTEENREKHSAFSGFLKYYAYFAVFSGFLFFAVLYGQIYYDLIPVGKIVKCIDMEKSLKKGGVFAVIPHMPGNPSTADITNDLFGWRRGAKDVGAVLKVYEKAYPGMFVLTNHYAIADELVFYGGFAPAVNIYNISDFLNQYDLWQDLSKINGRDALFVMDNKYMINPVRTYKCCFKSVKEIGGFDVYVKSRPVRTYYLYLMKDFNAAAAEKRLSAGSRMY